MLTCAFCLFVFVEYCSHGVFSCGLGVFERNTHAYDNTPGYFSPCYFPQVVSSTGVV